MKDEATRIRRELAQIEVRRGPCVPPELRARAAAWLRTERGRGRSIRDLAAEIGVTRGTVTRWTKTDVRTFVPVQVVAESERRGVRVVSAGGFAIEGVTLAEAAALLRELG